MKTIFGWISLYLVGLVWFVAAGMFALFAVLNPETLKSSLVQNGTYQKIVPAALEEAQNSNQADQSNELPFDDPGVKGAIDKAFPAGDLREKSETVIDSVFAWLEGKTAQPEFRLDFSSNKQVLATEIGQYAESRAAGLPPCTIADLEAARSANVFTVKCLPPGVTPAGARQEAAAQVSGNEEFLRDPIVTQDTLKENNNQLGGTEINAEPLKGLYQNKQLLSWGLVVLAVLLAAAGIMLSADRLRAIKRLAQIFLMSAISLGILAIVVKFVGNRLTSAPGPDKISSDIALPIVSDLLNRAGTVYAWFAVISLFLGFGLLFIYKRQKPASSSASM